MNEAFIRAAMISDVDESVYPFFIPAVKALESIEFSPFVTFFVGENGSGKSTLTESIAIAAGFNAEGGTKNYNFTTQDTASSLSDKITLMRGSRREKYGYFLRAESFILLQITLRKVLSANTARYHFCLMENAFMNNHIAKLFYPLSKTSV